MMLVNNRYSGAVLLVGLLSISAPPVMAASCNAEQTAVAADKRYRDNHDGTVSDTVSGLEWKQCVEGMSGPACENGSASDYNWQQAQGRAEAVNAKGFANRTDWRLPTLQELSSLQEARCYGGELAAALYPNSPKGWLWSATLHPRYEGKAWAVVHSGGSDYADTQASRYQVRLVRSQP